MPNIRRYNKGQYDQKELLIKIVKKDTSRETAVERAEARSSAKPSYVPMQVDEMAQAERRGRPKTSEGGLAKEMKALKEVIEQQSVSLQQHGQALQFLMQPHIDKIQKQQQEAPVQWEMLGSPSGEHVPVPADS